MGVGTFSITALEHADCLAREAGPLGELLLREPGSFAQLPEPPAERDVLSENGASRFAFRHIVSIPAAVTSENTGDFPMGTLPAFPQRSHGVAGLPPCREADFRYRPATVGRRR